MSGMNSQVKRIRQTLADVNSTWNSEVAYWQNSSQLSWRQAAQLKMALPIETPSLHKETYKHN
jgi:hypothetical protein